MVRINGNGILRAGDRTWELRPGRFALVPHEAGHDIASDADAATTDLFDSSEGSVESLRDQARRSCSVWICKPCHRGLHGGKPESSVEIDFPWGCIEKHLAVGAAMTQEPIENPAAETVALVERVANPDDGRSVLIALTPAGKRLIDRALTEHTKTQTELCTGLSDKELAALDRLLVKWLRQFE